MMLLLTIDFFQRWAIENPTSRCYLVFSDERLMTRDKNLIMRTLEETFGPEKERVEFILGIDYLWPNSNDRVIFDEIDIFLFDQADKFYKRQFLWDDNVWVTGLTATPFRSEDTLNNEVHFAQDKCSFILIRSE